MPASSHFVLEMEQLQTALAGFKDVTSRKSAKHVSVKLLVSNQSLEVGFKQKWENGDTKWAKPGNGNVVLQ